MNIFSKLTQLETRFASVEPSLHAFVPEEERFERLRRDASTLEETYPDPDHRPALFGALIGVKDIFHAEGFPTRAGSQLPPDVLTGPEADAVTRLKQAGALIVGKTVTTEFAYFGPGPTRNPHNPEYTPGGSSSGSAAAVAAELCEIALGTQTIGSVNRPAAFCGVIGFKPSYDRVSRAGVIPLSPSVDHVGVFASAVETVSRAAAVLIPDWAPIPHSLPSNPVCAVPGGSYLDHTEVEGLEHFWATVTQLECAGMTVRRIPAMTDFEDIYQRHYLIVAYDAARVHEKWFAEFGTLYHAKTVELIQRGQQIREPEYVHALEGRAKLRQELTNLMETEGIDVWLSPPAPGPAPRGLASTGNPVMNLPWTHAGFPTLTLPAGTHQDGLPMGIQLAAGWYGDEQLLAWAQILNASLCYDEST